MRHRTFVVLVLLMALIAACGDGGGADTTTAGAAETTTGDTGAATTDCGGAATTMAPEEGASLEGVELSLWGWSSSDAENAALSDLVAPVLRGDGGDGHVPAAGRVRRRPPGGADLG